MSPDVGKLCSEEKITGLSAIGMQKGQGLSGGGLGLIQSLRELVALLPWFGSPREQKQLFSSVQGPD